jgi:hypothetical protein
MDIPALGIAHARALKRLIALKCEKRRLKGLWMRAESVSTTLLDNIIVNDFLYVFGCRLFCG